ncbi:MAG: VCBS repeat-containing protein, partial [Ferruginibacter sp.]|nr:VCBS repeat-containing protein [Ferruginibacter sp.]
MNFKKKYLLIIIIFLVAGCKRKTDSSENNNTVFSLQQNCGITFTNKVENTKDFNIFSYRNFYNGGGCAIGDINNDGLADVYFTANQGSNKLYLNKGNFQFDDITAKAGVTDSTSWSTGVTLVDIDGDGWLDIYVCSAGFINGVPPESKLFMNNHDLSFTEKAAEYGLQNKGGYATHAAFFDADDDGDLDCFIINNSFIPTNTLNYENKRNLRAKDWPVKDFLKGGGDRFLRNDNNKFIDVSEQAGIHGSLISFGLGVTVGDANNDGWPDVYVSNDFFERDYLYINQHNGTFKDHVENYVEHISHSSMGADMADVNNDGRPDIFTTEMLPDNDYRLKTTSSFEGIDINRQKIKSGFYRQYMQNTLQINGGSFTTSGKNKQTKFLETAYYSAVAASDWSWGGLIFDADNNAQPDIFVSNGIYHDVTDQDFIDFFADQLYQKMAISGEKEDVEKIINKMPSVPIVNNMFVNEGNLHFTDKAADWGMGTPSFSNGAAYGDLDNDGDLDLIVNNVN